MLGVRRCIGLVLAASLVVTVGTAGPVVSQQPAERQTITLFEPEKGGFEKSINQGKRGISPGDVILFTQRELDPDTCEKVGQLVGRLQIVKLIGRENAIFDGNFTVRLGDGKITAAGATRFSEFQGTDPVLAVTGGTGAYRDASGEVRLTEGVTRCGVKGGLITIDVGPRP